jgi:hypothetical protein
MAYDRYDTRRERDWRGSDHDRGRREDRGFFERAGDEIASWFGDDEAEQRRRYDERMNRDGRFNRDREDDRNAYRGGARYEDERGSSRPMNWTSSDRDYARGRESSGWGGNDRDFSSRGFGSNRQSLGSGSSYGSGSDRGYGSGGFGGAFSGEDRDRGYRPMTGDYGRSESPWGRDDYRRTSYAGSNRDNDRHYDEWRRRQLDELDRDYDQYCRERQDRFESDFGQWRNQRMSKRQQLGSIREHMDVVGSDGETVGKVDTVRGDHIILTKSDSDDNRHHSIDCSMVESIEGDQIRLNMPAEEAKSRFGDAEEGQAMFGGNDRDEHVNLERSFSGTYR